MWHRDALVPRFAQSRQGQGATPRPGPPGREATTRGVAGVDGATTVWAAEPLHLRRQGLGSAALPATPRTGLGLSDRVCGQIPSIAHSHGTLHAQPALRFARP